MDDPKRGFLVILIKASETLILEHPDTKETFEVCLFDKYGFPMTGKLSLKCTKKHKIIRKNKE